MASSGAGSEVPRDVLHLEKNRFAAVRVGDSVRAAYLVDHMCKHEDVSIKWVRIQTLDPAVCVMDGRTLIVDKTAVLCKLRCGHPRKKYSENICPKGLPDEPDAGLMRELKKFVNVGKPFVRRYELMAIHLFGSVWVCQAGEHICSHVKECKINVLVEPGQIAPVLLCHAYDEIKVSDVLFKISNEKPNGSTTPSGDAPRNGEVVEEDVFYEKGTCLAVVKDSDVRVCRAEENICEHLTDIQVRWLSSIPPQNHLILVEGAVTTIDIKTVLASVRLINTNDGLMFPAEEKKKVFAILEKRRGLVGLPCVESGSGVSEISPSEVSEEERVNEANAVQRSGPTPRDERSRGEETIASLTRNGRSATSQVPQEQGAQGTDENRNINTSGTFGRKAVVHLKKLSVGSETSLNVVTGDSAGTTNGGRKKRSGFSPADRDEDRDEDNGYIYQNGNYLAVRNEANSFWLAKALQDVRQNTRKVRIQWLTRKDGRADDDIYHADFADKIEMRSILCKVKLEEAGKKFLRLPKPMKKEVLSWLQCSLEVEEAKNKAGNEKGKVRANVQHPKGGEEGKTSDDAERTRVNKRKVKPAELKPTAGVVKQPMSKLVGEGTGGVKKRRVRKETRVEP